MGLIWLVGYWLVGWLVGWLVVYWLVGWLLGRGGRTPPKPRPSASIPQLIDYPIKDLIWLVGWLVIRAGGRCPPGSFARIGNLQLGSAAGRLDGGTVERLDGWTV